MSIFKLNDTDSLRLDKYLSSRDIFTQSGTTYTKSSYHFPISSTEYNKPYYNGAYDEEESYNITDIPVTIRDENSDNDKTLFPTATNYYVKKGNTDYQLYCAKNGSYVVPDYIIDDVPVESGAIEDENGGMAITFQHSDNPILIQATGSYIGSTEVSISYTIKIPPLVNGVQEEIEYRVNGGSDNHSHIDISKELKISEQTEQVGDNYVWPPKTIYFDDYHAIPNFGNNLENISISWYKSSELLLRLTTSRYKFIDNTHYLKVYYRETDSGDQFSLSTMSESTESGTTVYSYSGLSPGVTYDIKLTYSDTSGTIYHTSNITTITAPSTSSFTRCALTVNSDGTPTYDGIVLLGSDTSNYTYTNTNIFPISNAYYDETTGELMYTLDEEEYVATQKSPEIISF